MTLNKHIERIIAAAGIAGTLAFGAWAGQAIAHADPIGMIDLTEIDRIMEREHPNHDYELPVCVEEDCSDQVGQTGMWLDRDTGNWYYERGESTWLINDDTVGWDAGYEG